jgi:hypothetical protein
VERGAGAQVGVSGLVWDGSWRVVQGSGAGRVRPLSRRCILMNVSSRKSHNCVCQAADCRCGLLHVWVAASEVSEVVWVLDKALAVVSEVVVADIAAVVGSNVAVATGGSGCKTRGWGLCNQLDSVCRHF